MAARARTNTSFGGLPTDANRDMIPVINQFVTADITGTPITSPKSMTTTVVFTLVVPLNAVRVTLLSGADMRVAELVAMTNYDLIKANTKEVIDCANMDKIYVSNDTTGTNNLYFKFYTV